MPRPTRFTPAGVPVHVTQRGNFKQPVFAGESDYLDFLRLLRPYSGMYENRVVGYCLLSNHFHLVVIPRMDDGVSKMMQILNSVYTRAVNERLERTGHIWQARFWSGSMDDKHYRTALGYVDLNPLRAGLVKEAMEYRWSTAAAHAGYCAYPEWVDAAEFARMYTSAEWREILRTEQNEGDVAALRRATKLGALTGNPEFVKQLEMKYGRTITRRPAGRPKNIGV